MVVTDVRDADAADEVDERVAVDVGDRRAARSVGDDRLVDDQRAAPPRGARARGSRGCAGPGSRSGSRSRGSPPRAAMYRSDGSVQHPVAAWTRATSPTIPSSSSESGSTTRGDRSSARRRDAGDRCARRKPVCPRRPASRPRSRAASRSSRTAASRKAEEIRTTRAAASSCTGGSSAGRCGSKASSKSRASRLPPQYWSSRPRGSQIAAWASPQSPPLSGRDELDARVAEVEKRFAGGDVPLAAVLGRVRDRSRTGRVLEAPRRPASRPRALRPGCRRLAPRAPLAVTTARRRARRRCTAPPRSRACSPSRRRAAPRRSAHGPRRGRTAP